MLNPAWVPTPLVDPADRPPVPIVPVRPVGSRRTLKAGTTFAALALTFMAWKALGRFDPERYARRVRRALERLGGLWVKAGQLLSLRIDILPVEWCRELARLQTQALGFSEEAARRIVELELGTPIDVVFDRWEPAPLAAASIGQVHRARLRAEQRWVAVKVQKPGSGALFERDLALIRRAVGILKFFRLFPHLNWDAGLHELRQIMKEELHFGYEAAMLRRMRRTLRAHGVYAPKVFSRYSTPRVLVMEFLPVVFMADYIRMAREDPDRLRAWQAANGVNPRRVARRLVYSLERQMLEDNLFHGDMHPGNIGLLRDSRVALIDFGAANFTDREYLQRFAAFTRAIAMQAHGKAADMALLLCARLPSIDTTVVRERLIHALRGWSSRTLVPELPYVVRSLNALTLDVMRVLLKSRCTMEWAWLRLHRAIATLDASLLALDPAIDYRALTAKYFERADRRRLQSASRVGGVRRALSAARAPDVQARARDYAMFQAQLIRRQAQTFRGVGRKAVGVAAAILSVAMAAVVAQAGAALVLGLRSWAGAWTTGWKTGQLAALLDRVPPLGLETCVAILIVDVWIWHALRRLRRELMRRDRGLAQSTAAG